MLSFAVEVRAIAVQVAYEEQLIQVVGDLVIQQMIVIVVVEKFGEQLLCQVH